MRKQLTRRDLTLAALLAFAIGLIIGWFIHGQSPRRTRLPPAAADTGDNGGTSGVGGVHGSSSITITGDTEGLLVPGSTLPIDLSLDNPNDFDYTVQHLTVTVSAVHAPQSSTNRPCSPADFAVSPLAEGIEFTIGSGTEDSLSGLAVAQDNWPTVGMINRPVNQNGCKGATLTLDYDASGTEVDR